VDHHRAAAQRFVPDLAGVAAVDPARTPPAGWAAGRGSPSMRSNMDNIVKHQQALDPQTSEVRE
jgi:hypothetical protein